MEFPIKNGDFPWQNVSSPEGTAIFCQLPVYQWLSIKKGTLILRVDESWLEIPLTDPMKYNSTTNYHDNNDEENY